MQALTHTIGATAVMVAPPRNLINAEAYQVRAYLQGEIIKNSLGSLFWVVIAGTSAAEPTASGGATTAETGGPTWQHIVPGWRRTFNACNTGATSITIAVGIKPTAGVGATVLVTNGTFNITGPNNIQDPIYAISSAGGGVLVTQDI